MSIIDLPLLPLGKGRDLGAERGVECPGDLPAASDPDLVERARAAKAALGDRVFVLGHHYQRDEVIQFADVTGDSFKLARDAAGAAGGRVHRLLRRALHGRVRRHPHRAGPEGRSCPTWPPAARWPTWPGSRQVEDAWDALAEAGVAGQRRTRHLHELQRRHQGVLRPQRRRRLHVVQRRRGARVGVRAEGTARRKVLFFPDQHLGRNTAVLKMGIPLDDCVVWDPLQPGGGLTAEELQRRAVILWKGHCSVHGRFTADVVDDAARASTPGINILVHPECPHEVVLKADLVGSTEFIIKTIEAAPAGHDLGDRHRAQPRQAPRRRTPRQDDRLPRPQRLLLLDDEPHRPAPPRLGAGVAGRRRRRQPDHRSTPTPSATPWSRSQRMLDLPGQVAPRLISPRSASPRPGREGVERLAEPLGAAQGAATSSSTSSPPVAISSWPARGRGSPQPPGSGGRGGPSGRRPPARRARSQSGSIPQREPALMSCSIGSSAARASRTAISVRLSRWLRAGRGEGVEGALLVEVDQPDAAAGDVGERSPSSTAARTRSPAPRGGC